MCFPLVRGANDGAAMPRELTRLKSEPQFKPFVYLNGAVAGLWAACVSGSVRTLAVPSYLARSRRSFARDPALPDVQMS